MKCVELGAKLWRNAKARRIEQDLVDPFAQIGWQHGFNLAQGAVGSLGELRAAPGLHHACSQDESGDLLAIKHERWNIEIAAQSVADSGFACDGYAGKLQVLHIAVDGAVRDLQLFGQMPGGLQPPGAQQLNDSKEPVGTTHTALC